MKRFETHSHSHYSSIRLIDSINKPRDMILTAYKLGYAGITLTDHEALCGHIEWLELEKELKEKGEISKDFKCGLGNEIYLIDERGPKQKYYHFILIAKNTLGHRALRELSSAAWLNGYSDRGMERVPTTRKELAAIIKKYPGTLIGTNACFVKGTKVQTKEGYKNIEDITSNDYIYNKYGEWEKVNFPTSRFYQGEGRKISFFELNDTITCTNNHQFLVTTQNWLKTKNPARWIEAKDLKSGKGSQKHICLFPISPIYSNKNIIYRKEWENSLRKINYKPKYLLKDEILLSPEVMRLFGLWLGDGCISITEKTRRIGITFSLKEFNSYWENFVQKASEEIGIIWTKQILEKQNKVELTSNSIEAVELFYYLFGLSHAQNKYVPERLKHISEESDWNLFWGYSLADGYFRTRTKDKYSYGEFCSVSVSKKLTQDFQIILKSLGIRSSITISEEKIDKNQVHHNEAYYLTSSNNAWININKVENYDNECLLKILKTAQLHDSKKHCVIDGIKYKKIYIKEIEEVQLNQEVHCLNVNSHSFCCQGVIVHNCIGGKVGSLVLALIEAEKNDNLNEIYKIKKEIDDFLHWCKELFGDDFYFEIAPGTSPDQKRFNQRAKAIAQFYGLKMICATDAHYLTADLREVHKAFLNSKDGEREVDSFYHDAHLMSNEEAFEKISPFYTQEEFDEMCKNSLEIMEKIETYELFHNPIIPEVKLPPCVKFYDESLSSYPILQSLRNSDNIQERTWAKNCLLSLKERNLEKDEYFERLELEAKIIKDISEKLGNCLFTYFNTFNHYIDLFWECGAVVGPGRGSAGSFLSNYLLNITQLDPIQWGLPYFRFLNEDRAELPDIDIDLPPSKRPLILKEIRKERGELNVVQVATFGTESARAAIACACRGYRSKDYPKGIDIDISQYMSSLVPFERGISWTIDECLNGNEEKGRKPVKELIKQIAQYPGLEEIIRGVEGVVCRRGQHASGVMLYNVSPFETTALMRSPNGDITTQYDLKKSESVGDTKFDFLVTDICDKISTCLDLLMKDGFFTGLKKREIYNQYLHPQVLNLNDPKIWDALAAGTVQDVFQFNTPIGIQTAKAIMPVNPTEMTAANALMRLTAQEGQERPFDRYVRFKKDISLWYQEMDAAGLTKEEQKTLEPYYLKDYGVPASQEALMLLTMDPKISHFTLGESNHCRKILAKFLGTLYY